MKIDPVCTAIPIPRTENWAPPSLPAVSAELLFGGAKEIVIRHQGDDYRLRITRNDKLILTK
jgi:hemin uptake protein HemP